jgi:hypothetical protein
MIVHLSGNIKVSIIIKNQPSHKNNVSHVLENLER